MNDWWKQRPSYGLHSVLQKASGRFKACLYAVFHSTRHAHEKVMTSTDSCASVECGDQSHSCGTC
eukprot:2232061-Amphidinium_carterae.1